MSSELKLIKAPHSLCQAGPATVVGLIRHFGYQHLYRHASCSSRSRLQYATPTERWLNFRRSVVLGPKLTTVSVLAARPLALDTLYTESALANRRLSSTITYSFTSALKNLINDTNSGRLRALFHISPPVRIRSNFSSTLFSGELVNVSVRSQLGRKIWMKTDPHCVGSRNVAHVWS